MNCYPTSTYSTYSGRGSKTISNVFRPIAKGPIIKATWPQLASLQLITKYRLFVGGYGSGKTFLGAVDEVAHALKHPRVNQGYFAPTYPQIRDIFYPTMEEVAPLMGLRADIREGNHEVHLRCGRYNYGVIKCRSMEKPETIVGFKIGNCFVDEIDTMPIFKARNAWRKIIGRLRWESSGGVLNGALVGTTPEGFKIAHELFVKGPKKNPLLHSLYSYVRASTYSNRKNLPPGYIQSLLATYPESLVDAYLDGKFVNLATGTVYRGYDRHRCDTVEVMAPGEPIHVGMDFNVEKMAARAFVDRGAYGWHCVAELDNILDTPAMIKAIGDKWSGRVIYVYPDASGKNRKASDASKTDISLLEQAGFVVRVNSRNPLVKDRYTSVNKRFEIGMLFVNSRECPTTVENLEQQAFDLSGSPDKTSGNDHGNDAFGYPIAYNFPIERPIIDLNVTFPR